MDRKMLNELVQAGAMPEPTFDVKRVDSVWFASSTILGASFLGNGETKKKAIDDLLSRVPIPDKPASKPKLPIGAFDLQITSETISIRHGNRGIVVPVTSNLQPLLWRIAKDDYNANVQ